MKAISGIALVVLSLALLGAAPPETEEARVLAGKLQSALQAELLAALKEGGPPRAVEVCRNRAPEIAGRISRESGWKVGRTSLRYRSSRNAPDAWEAKVLADFEARAAAGEEIGGLERSEVVEAQGRRTLRYMKAIRTGEPCLGCHGAALKPEVEAKLKALYPADRATGFSTGDLRGAFTLSKDLGN